MANYKISQNVVSMLREKWSNFCSECRIALSDENFAKMKELEELSKDRSDNEWVLEEKQIDAEWFDNFYRAIKQMEKRGGELINKLEKRTFTVENFKNCILVDLANGCCEVKHEKSDSFIRIPSFEYEVGSRMCCFYGSSIGVMDCEKVIEEELER